jgi:hypothetical protein
MRKILVLSALGALALAVGGSAKAATISIGTGLNGGAITLQASGATPGPVVWSGAVGTYNINSVNGIDLTSASLNSDALDATTTGTSDVLDVYVTVSDVSNFSGVLSTLSGLTVNFLTKGWSVTESTFEDNSNTVFGMSNLLATHSFTSGPDIFTAFTPVSVTAPFSVTELYQISSNGLRGDANDTIDISGSVPELSTWAMLGIGFAGIGLAGLTRRRKTFHYAS